MVDMTNDVVRFEAMFADRFTEKDSAYMELKSKPLSNPVVIHPWKPFRKVWNKRWDYSNKRNQDERSKDRENDRNDDRHRQNSYNRHRDRSQGENSRHGHRDRSESGRDRHHDNQDKRNRHRDRS